MWGIDGEHSFLAERFGARRVVLVDTYKTDEYERKHKEIDSSVEFVQADATSPDLVDKIGEVDVVWCFGVLYHLPSPYQLLQSLRQVCRETLLLESFTAPEVPGLHQVGFYVPYLSDKDRTMWNVKSGALALGVDTRFAPEQGDANNFWFLTPTSVRALLRTAGFEVSRVIPSPSGPLRHVFIASVAPAAPLDLE
jgi:SAM-dependent methyltransferase